MRFARPLLAVTPFLLLVAATPANAAVPHTVQPGETLWSIAAANNLTTRTVAAYNGLPETAQVVLGSTINVPTTVEGAAALQAQGVKLEGVAPQAAPAAAPAAPAAPAASSGGAPPPAGSYVVRAGDTLSGLAANAGVAMSQMAAANGLDPSAPLLTGTVLKLPTGAPTPARASEPLPSQRVVPAAAPAATPTRVGAADIQSVASQHGVSPSLAAAIAWQESGFNNGMVSSANARGVMQVMPGTWDFVERNLAGRKLDPGSANDNVHAGVIYLKHLLEQTGGDENTAIAGYYQGLGAVRSRGLFDDTQKYVANVQALRSRFGG
jgi:soluble lytic murein transglycosylase-like protein